MYVHCSSEHPLRCYFHIVNNWIYIQQEEQSNVKKLPMTLYHLKFNSMYSYCSYFILELTTQNS